jgi:CheY-like chemotaxis protein
MVITVEDSGRGLKQEHIAILFDEFTRFDMDKNNLQEGTGLGLAITYSFIKTMGGDISVESEYGKGSVFTVTLPQGIVSSEKVAVVNDPEYKKVLIFERRESCIQSITKAMDDFGVEYKLVASVSDFNNELSHGQYEFIFVASSLYKSVNKICMSVKNKAFIWLIAEFGELIRDRNVSVLFTPIYSIPLANILNGVLENYIRIYDRKYESGFTAPDAKVLVVDDINMNLVVARGLMQPYNMQIDLCSSGADAIEAMLTKHYDLVFMDHMMPGMDGLEAVQRIRAMALRDSHYADIPIIALTANAVTGTKEMFMENGFNDFLSKPIDTATLNSILEKWIPKDKQIHTSEMLRTQINETDGELVIHGVDIKKGISQTGNSLDDYRNALIIFCKDGIDKIGEIQACLENNDIKLFSTYIHAIKSISASIGADALSSYAKNLEVAGLSDDTDFIFTHTPVFLIEFEKMINNIKEALLRERSTSDHTASIDKDSLITDLIKLQAALDNYNIPAINEISKNLSKLTNDPDIGESISEILHLKLAGRYDEAVLFINNVLMTLKN